MRLLAPACHSGESPSGEEESHPLVSEGIASANNSANKIGLPPGAALASACHSDESPSGDEESHPLVSEGIASANNSANNSANKIGLPPPRERGDDLFVLSG